MRNKNQVLDWLHTRVANGDIEKLSETELLSLILSDDKPAQALTKRFGGLKGLASQPLEKFLDIRGLGDAKIIRIASCFELARRVVATVMSEMQDQPYLLKNSEDKAG